MPVASSNFGPVLEPGLRKVFFQGYKDKPEQFTTVYTIKSSKKAVEHDYHIAGLGEWDEKESMGSAATDILRPGEQIDYTHAEYAKQCQVERKFIDDEMYDVISKLPRSLGKGGRSKAETTAAAIINGGFTNTGYDGVSLFNSSHPRYGAIGGTVGNLATGALSDATVKTALTLGRAMTDDAGMKIEWKGKRLFVPAELEFTAIKITQSPLESDTTDNNVNSLKGLQPFVWDYLTSTTAWFIQDTSMTDMLLFYWRIRPEFNKDKEFTTMLAAWLGYERFSCGYSDFRFAIGSLGT